MNRICPICNQEFRPGEMIHRTEIHDEVEVPDDFSEPKAWSPNTGAWKHDICEPFPKN